MRFLLAVCLLFSGFLNAQDYFLKTFTGAVGMASRSVSEVTLDGGVIHVGQQLGTGELLVRRMDKCGNQVWVKTIKHASEPMNVIDIVRDTNNNFVFAGNLGYFNNGGRPFILSIAADGSLNYMKSVDLSSNKESIAYSFIRNTDGDFFLYFNYNTGGVGTSDISIAKFSPDGNLLWFKSFPGMTNWGRAFGTTDGGILFRAGSAFAKMNPDGSIAWSNQYVGLGYVDYPVEVDGGFIMFKYPSGGVNKTTNIIKLTDTGGVAWVSNDFQGFLPRRGILRKNGNVLFTGSTGGIGLVEVDTATGAIIHFKEVDPDTSRNLEGADLFEDSKGNIFISGVDNSNLTSVNVYLKVDSSLNLPICSSVDLPIPTTKSAVVTTIKNTVSTTNRNSQELSIVDEVFSDSLIRDKSNVINCGSQMDRGDFILGEDTILCPEKTLTIGNVNSFYDDYLWSTGDTSKEITIYSAGSYSVRLIAACDTLRDTINVSYYPEIDLFIGQDSAICQGDSIVLQSNFSLSNYIWSTGDTTSEIVVKNAGLYWLETTTVCGKVRDSIAISIQPPSTQLNLGEDVLLCPGEEIILGDSLTDFDQFLWSTGETTQFIRVSDSALYTLMAFTRCDTLEDQVRVALAPEIDASFSMDTPRVKTFEEVLFYRANQMGLTAEWDMGNGEKLTGDTIRYNYKIPGNYQVKLTITSQEGCVFSFSRGLTVIPSDYLIPNAFSPNNDGTNDAFKPTGKDISSYQMTIFDRWGNEIFSKESTAWDGRNKEGRKVKGNSYFYEIVINWQYGGSSIFKGNLNLFRD